MRLLGPHLSEISHRSLRFLSPVRRRGTFLAEISKSSSSMYSASLLEAISIIGDPPRSRPPSLKWNRLLYRKVPGGFRRHAKTIRFYPHLSLKPIETQRISSDSSEEETNPWVGFVTKVFDMLKVLKKPAIAALLVGVLLTADPFGAIAASGGRMGGRAFSSKSSSPSYSRSYSVPSGSGFSYSVPYYAPSPFGAAGGFYMGPMVGVGFGAGSGFFILMMGFAAFVLLTGFLSDRSDDESVLTAVQKTSVLKLQVDVKRSVEDGEKRFNQLSIEERGKFDEETLVNVNNIKRQRTTSYSSKTFSNEYIVITILVAAEGVHKLPVINGSADLKAALQKLGSIPANKTMAVEVLWTPQNENDTLSERELLEDYPLLRPL
ncbi:hypothetical protein KFK09_004363 [Dendrobium nobile]|uniref:Myelin-associated oligodendrocyte basic protein n=1 Tax=Dendrobium nobile TaxID=94219 RepID=A0A8T3C2K9_DENNO|nr:hypothetical protein KFK09_004363 [Dendrobium nobile]